ncbi:MAG: Septum site-determining protein MinD [bacterium ADurb.Bin243]|nr:MAG: Septum site-determining protein MinD [bacterium ADurb.Bin243]HOD40358.1 Mrp/NBP35 family ATP-binding protein [Candidatus Wallbacteria bacterium]
MDLSTDNKEKNLKRIKNAILVMSGKGGVGKSTVAVNLARALNVSGKKVGIMDIDIHGPSVAKMLDVEKENLSQTPTGFLAPVKVSENFYAASVAFLLETDCTPVIWRGPMKSNFITQMLDSFAWPELDYLIIDCPPGTGDEHMTIIQAIEKVTGAVIVTTPQHLACLDVKKAVNFLKQMSVNIIGLIENMAYFECPDCGKRIEIFQKGGAGELMNEFKIPLLGTLPIETAVGESGETGTSLFEKTPPSAVAKTFLEIAQKLSSNKNNQKESEVNYV